MAHKTVLSKVIGEETTEIETEKAKSLKHQIRTYQTQKQMESSDEESEAESSDHGEVKHQIPDRLKKKTRKEKRKLVS